MIRTIVITSVAAMLLSAALVNAGGSAYKVTYVSAEHIYINGGTEDGLTVGDTLTFIGKNRDTVLVELVYTAGHSASGIRVSGTGLPVVGDQLLASPKVQTEIPIVPEQIIVSEPPENAPKEIVQEEPFKDETVPPTELKGTISFGIYHWSDQSPANLDFTQTNTRMNLKVHRLWDEHLTLAIRSRGRYDARGWANARAGSSAWENRLWELSLIYENDESGVYAAAGRILPRRLAAAGYLDGAMAEFRLSNSTRLGVLGGSQPDWLYRTSGPSLNRGGAYFTFLSGSRRTFYFEQTLAGIGEAHADRISRSFIALSGTMSYGTRWGLSHTAEIDVNTGWRKERSGQTVAVSRAYVYGYYRMSRALRFGLSYDNLKRYWTYEYISMADSLFDDRARRGWRARADLSPLQNWYLSGSFGLRHNPDENATETYSFDVRKTRFIMHAVSVSFMHNGFDGPQEHGTNYSARVQVFTVTPGIWHFAYGRYKYTIDDVNESRSSWYLESGLDTDFGRNYYAGGSVQYSTGADIDGWRYQLSIGYRL